MKSSSERNATKSSAAKAASKKSNTTNASATKTTAKKSPPKPSDASIYTDPGLREQLKREIMAGDKGGKPGQWSARKAQLLAREYETAGGGYKKGAKKGATQKSLVKWTEEEWTTASGGKAIHDDGTVERYLPKEAWDKLTPAEKRATNRRKQAASKKGEQFVANTAAAKRARKAATKK